MIDGLDPSVGERVVDRVTAIEQGAVAVLVAGSYAQGRADALSDLDLVVVLDSEPAVAYRTWFEEQSGALPLHVSAGFRTVGRCLADRERPAYWGLGFPVHNVTAYLWATEDARALLGDPPDYVHPPAEPALEDFVEFVTKVQRCASRGDSVGVRTFAREAAFRAPGLLRPLNVETVVRDRREAVEAARSLTIAPEHYREDFEAATGVVETDDEAVEQAALRLGRELLAYLRERAPDVDPQPEIARYLADGTLERRLGFRGA